MIAVPLQAIANQQLTIQLDTQRYDLTVKETAGCMSASIERDGVELVSMSRVVAGAPLLPYTYLSEPGNFVLLTEGDELPWWPTFGVTQFLVWVSAAEIAALPA